MTKIHIIGPSGSGKSTLAQKIANVTGALSFDLDYISYRGGAGGWKRTSESLEVKLAMVHEISLYDNWVTEGIYDDWTEELIEKCDILIWMDIPYPVVAWRVIKRHYQRSKAGDNRYKGIVRLLIFLLWILRYYYYPDDKNPSRWRAFKAITKSKKWWISYKVDSDLAGIITTYKELAKFENGSNI